MPIEQDGSGRRNYLSVRTFRIYAFPCLLVLATAAFVWLWIGRWTEYRAQPSVRHLTFVSVNDVYQIDGVDDGQVGGLHRLRTLLQWIRREAPEVILLHAGDFVGPSLVSSELKGEQMIEAMNMLYRDGKPDRMFVVFGNHEFDYSACTDANASLNQRVAGSQFTWLNSNLDFAGCAGMKGLASHARVKKEGVVLTVNGVKVGLFGIGLTPDRMENTRSDKYPITPDEVEAARRSLAGLQKQGAEFIVAVTHLLWTEDEKLLRELGSNGLDLLIGGHDHDNMTLPRGAADPRGFKADSDARTAWRIDVDVPPSGKAELRAQLITLNSAIPADQEISRYAEARTAEAEARICKKRGKPDDPKCLSADIGRTQARLDLRETVSRSRETGFGDWLADLLIANTGAEVGMINAGSLGLDAEVAAGTGLKLRNIVQMFRYDDVVAVRSFPANEVCKAIGHGFASPGAGAWLHAGGVGVDIELPQKPGNAVKVRGFTGLPRLTCDSTDPVKVASVPFVLCGRDGYGLVPPDNIPAGANCETVLRSHPLDGSPARITAGTTLSQLAEQGIRDAEPKGIEPATDSRVKFIKPAPGK